MSPGIMIEFVNKMSQSEGYDYLKNHILFNAAPTVYHKKPSSLICLGSGTRDLPTLWHAHKQILCEELGMDYFELREDEQSITVLFYNRRMLEWYIKHPRNRRFLNDMGYVEENDLYQNLVILKGKFKQGCPHEVGIFIGIPIEDVEGFIQNNGQDCLMCRYWKVYGNEKKMERLFAIYDQVREDVVRKVLSSRK